MTFSDDDGAASLDAEDLKFFKKRAKFLGSLSNFAETDLSLVKGNKKHLK